jgi:hypothetical protein
MNLYIPSNVEKYLDDIEQWKGNINDIRSSKSKEEIEHKR